jgi:uncharacterized membrane protein
MAKGVTEQTWGKLRIEALSDGVFAIALTLLVLDIRLPDLARSTPTRDILHQMRLLGPSFLSFFITFVLGGSFWYMHHVTFHSVKYITRGLAAINILFLMFVSLLPFSTGLIGKLGPNHPFALAIYFTNQLALGLALNLLWVYARRHELIEKHAEHSAPRFLIAVQPLACVAALAAVAFAPIASYYLFLIVMVIARRISRKRFKPQPIDSPAPL